MTIVHLGKGFTLYEITLYINVNCLVLFKFRPEVPNEHRQLFQSKLKELRSLPCVKESRLIVGGQSITDPPERSKGFQHALLSFHEDEAALKEYQASKAHHE